GVSPHLIPHYALHSASGMISQVLKIRGPNLGAGGGPGGEAEALLAAATLLAEGRLPGVWVVLSGWTPELIPGRGAPPPPAAVGQALALALVEPRPAWRGPRLRIVSGQAEGDPDEAGPIATPDLPHLQAVLSSLDQVDQGEGPAPSVAWPP